ncbi:MAG: YidC/Oxa1 family membrane protein insertase [Patescibacteria group bacterium]
MLHVFWHDFLYTPLLNFLIWLYNGPAFGNLGVAIIYLTIIIRIVLLPFTVVSERSKILYGKLSQKIDKIGQDFKNDPIQKKEMIRKVMREHRVSPWAKVMVLGVQALILVLLYQVFIGGINGKLGDLYFWVTRPDFINTDFFGFDLGETKNLFWSGLVGAILFLEIFIDYRSKSTGLTKSEVAYMIFFPAACFFILWVLPIAKSIFILTSLCFSFLVIFFRQIFKNKFKIGEAVDVKAK